MTIRISEMVAAIRATPDSRAEQVTQALFGEPVQIVSTENDWVQVKLADQYIGWVSDSMLRQTNWKDCRFLRQDLPVCIQSHGHQRETWIPKGACVPELSTFEFAEKTFAYLATPEWISAEWQAENFLAVALQYLGTPYLWGGRSSWGIDCSALVQLAVFLNGGLLLPRDASKQAKVFPVISWKERKTGDLAFFSNKAGKVIHTGILTKPDQILHAYGHVRLSRVSEEGIYSDWKSGFSHERTVICRFLL